MSYTVNKKELKFYREMFLIRYTEEKLLNLFSKGFLRGTIHTCIGQEACAVGVINAIDKSKDIVFSNHRSHGHFISYCGDIKSLILEIMGKSTGVCAGIGGSQHLHKGNFYSSGIQGGLVPWALGTAFAEKNKNSNAIAIIFMGDGTLSEGIVYECLNIASLWNLPVLFVVEDNKYAQSTPSWMEYAGKLIDRAKPFLIETTELFLEDVSEIYLKTKNIINNIRMTSKPHFLLLNTYRLAAHSKGDDYRSEKEINKFRQADPLVKYRQKLEKEYAANLNIIENGIKVLVDKIISNLTITTLQ